MTSCAGSSPRVWGTSKNTPGRFPNYRFIPTCVGNIGGTAQRPFSRPVHPHVCGEHSRTVKRRVDDIGSSPRVWGTLQINIVFSHFQRFIPTCVGNIVFPNAHKLPPAVHPHVCGEHGSMRFSSARMCGSSPRVWGTSNPKRDHLPTTRFIPTCVGNIHPIYPNIRFLSVHPHVCGEHFSCLLLGYFSCGSSPRVWGTLGMDAG